MPKPTNHYGLTAANRDVIRSKNLVVERGGSRNVRDQKSWGGGPCLSASDIPVSNHNGIFPM